MSEPLSRIRITTTVSVEVEPGMYVELHEFTHWLTKTRLSPRERRELARFVPSVKEALTDSGVRHEAQP